MKKTFLAIGVLALMMLNVSASEIVGYGFSRESVVTPGFFTVYLDAHGKNLDKYWVECLGQGRQWNIVSPTRLHQGRNTYIVYADSTRKGDYVCGFYMNTTQKCDPETNGGWYCITEDEGQGDNTISFVSRENLECQKADLNLDGRVDINDLSKALCLKNKLDRKLIVALVNKYYDKKCEVL
jgi:hypothetical protein